MSFSETKAQLNLIRERLLKIKERIEKCEVQFPPMNALNTRAFFNTKHHLAGSGVGSTIFVSLLPEKPLRVDKPLVPSYRYEE